MYTLSPNKYVPAMLILSKNNPNGTATLSLKSVNSYAITLFNQCKSTIINPLQKLIYSK